MDEPAVVVQPVHPLPVGVQSQLTPPLPDEGGARLTPEMPVRRRHTQQIQGGRHHVHGWKQIGDLAALRVAGNGIQTTNGTRVTLL